MMIRDVTMYEGRTGLLHGEHEVLLEMGLNYCAGRGVEANLVEAHKWFNLAALRGSEAAKEYRCEISAEMTKEEIARAQRLARQWLKQH